jgi:hypothetical protein
MSGGFKVVGLHNIGDGMDKILQGFVAATKDELY